MTHSESNEGNLDVIKMCYTVIGEQVATFSSNLVSCLYIVESILSKFNVNFLSIQMISPCVN